MAKVSISAPVFSAYSRVRLSMYLRVLFGMNPRRKRSTYPSREYLLGLMRTTRILPGRDDMSISPEMVGLLAKNTLKPLGVLVETSATDVKSLRKSNYSLSPKSRHNSQKELDKGSFRDLGSRITVWGAALSVSSDKD